MSDLTSVRKKLESLQSKQKDVPKRGTVSGELLDHTARTNFIQENGNKAEDWLNYTRYIKNHVEFPDSDNQHNFLCGIYDLALKVTPVADNKRNLSYAVLLLDYANLKSTNSPDDARALYNHARVHMRRFAIVHIAAAEFELNQGYPNKCKKILEKANILSDTQPHGLLKKAIHNFDDGKGELLSKDEVDEYLKNEACTDKSGSTSSQDSTGDFSFSGPLGRNPLSSLSSNLPKVLQNGSLFSGPQRDVWTGDSQSKTSNIEERPVFHSKITNESANVSIELKDNTAPNPVDVNMGCCPRLPEHSAAPASCSKPPFRSYHSTPDMKRAKVSSEHKEIRVKPNMWMPRRVKKLNIPLVTPEDEGSEDEGSFDDIKPLSDIDTNITTASESMDQSHGHTSGYISSLSMNTKSYVIPDDPDDLRHSTIPECDEKQSTEILPMEICESQNENVNTSCKSPILAHSTRTSIPSDKDEQKENLPKRKPVIDLQVSRKSVVDVVSQPRTAGSFQPVSENWSKKRPVIRDCESSLAKSCVSTELKSQTDCNNPVKITPNTSTSGNIGHSGTPIPSSSTNIGHSGTPIPSSGTNIGHSGTPIPASSTTIGHSGTSIPTSSTNIGHSGTSIPTSSTNIGHSGTSIPTSSTNIGQSGTSIPTSSIHRHPGTSESLSAGYKLFNQAVHSDLLPQPHFRKPVDQPAHAHSQPVFATPSNHKSSVLPHQMTPMMMQYTPSMKSVQEIAVNGRSYSVLKVVGRGGSSKVYHCIDFENKQTVGIKCVDLSDADESIIKGYTNEITLLKRLQYSDKVIKMYDYEHDVQQACLLIVMELGDTDLASLFRTASKTKDITESLMKYYWEAMLKAVKVLHKEGIIHSDLKPANFLLVKGQLKLIDFGIANAIQQDRTSVVRDSQLGTFNYMSPEAICSGGMSMDGGQSQPLYKIGVKSDVWSLGCILYNMVYGRTPFQHITNHMHKYQAIVSPSYNIEFRDIPDKNLLDVMKRCLVRDVKLRPSIDELLNHPYLKRTKEPQAVPDTMQSLLAQLQAVANSPGKIKKLEHVLVQLKEKKAP